MYAPHSISTMIRSPTARAVCTFTTVTSSTEPGKQVRLDTRTYHKKNVLFSCSLVKIISTVKPTEIYNLAAQSHVKVSFDLAEYTAEVDGVGTLRLLGESTLFPVLCPSPPYIIITLNLRCNKDLRARVLGEILPGVHVRALRQSARGSAERDHSILPEITLRSRQTVCILVGLS